VWSYLSHQPSLFNIQNNPTDDPLMTLASNGDGWPAQDSVPENSRHEAPRTDSINDSPLLLLFSMLFVFFLSQINPAELSRIYIAVLVENL
jgi:hypothetical protein